MSEAVYTIDEAALIMKVSRSTLYRRVLAGDLKASKTGAMWRIAHLDFARFLKAHGDAELLKGLSQHVATTQPRGKNGRKLGGGPRLKYGERRVHKSIRITPTHWGYLGDAGKSSHLSTSEVVTRLAITLHERASIDVCAITLPDGMLAIVEPDTWAQIRHTAASQDTSPGAWIVETLKAQLEESGDG